MLPIGFRLDIKCLWSLDVILGGYVNLHEQKLANRQFGL
jgi:hypothetical protein